MAGFMLMRATDAIMIGALGKEPLAAMAIGNMWGFGLAILGHGAARGLDPAVSQAFGAGDRLAAGRTLVRGWILAIAMAIPIMALHVLTAEGLALLGQPAHLLADAEIYALATMWGLPFAFAFDATRQFLQGLGIMRPATWVVLATVLLNVVLNQWLIHGGLGVPPLGILGSGIATSVCAVVVCTALVGVTWSVLLDWWPGWDGVFEVAPMWALLALALPASIQASLEVWAFIGAGFMMGWLGDVELDAHVIALNLTSLTFMIPFGISAGAATRVGNLLGAGQDWQRSGWLAIGLGAAVMAVSASCFFWVPEPLVSIYTNDPEVLAAGALLLPVAALFQVFDGVQAVAFGVLRGAGDIKVPTLANLLGYYVFAMPLGYWLAFEQHMGPRGVWLGLTGGLSMVAVLLVIRVARIGRTGGVRVTA